MISLKIDAKIGAIQIGTRYLVKCASLLHYEHVNLQSFPRKIIDGV